MIWEGESWFDVGWRLEGLVCDSGLEWSRGSAASRAVRGGACAQAWMLGAWYRLRARFGFAWPREEQVDCQWASVGLSRHPRRGFHYTKRRGEAELIVTAARRSVKHV